MKALLDTNVVLDAIACQVAEELVTLAANEAIEAYITANTVTDIYYITRKHFSDVETRDGNFLAHAGTLPVISPHDFLKTLGSR